MKNRIKGLKDSYDYPNHEEKFECVECSTVKPRREVDENGRVVGVNFKDVQNPGVCYVCMEKNRSEKAKHPMPEFRRTKHAQKSKGDGRGNGVTAYLTETECLILNFLAWRHNLTRSAILTEAFNRFCNERLKEQDYQVAKKWSDEQTDSRASNSLFD